MAVLFSAIVLMALTGLVAVAYSLVNHRRSILLGTANLLVGLIAASGGAPLDICTPPRIAETIEPDGGLADAYEQAYARYRALYPAIRDAT